MTQVLPTSSESSPPTERKDYMVVIAFLIVTLLPSTERLVNLCKNFWRIVRTRM